MIVSGGPDRRREEELHPEGYHLSWYKRMPDQCPFVCVCVRVRENAAHLFKHLLGVISINPTVSVHPSIQLFSQAASMSSESRLISPSDVNPPPSSWRTRWVSGCSSSSSSAIKQTVQVAAVHPSTEPPQEGPDG